VFDGPFCGPGAVATAGSGATTGGAGGVTATDDAVAPVDAAVSADAGSLRADDAGDEPPHDGGAGAHAADDDEGCACSAPGARVRGAAPWRGLCTCALFAIAALRRAARPRAGRLR
jgi:hypothetical protein